MKLRIILRLKNGPPLKFSDGLKTIHESEHLDIHSDGETFFSMHDEDGLVIVIGRLIGLRVSDDITESFQSDTKKIKHATKNLSLPEISKKLEGRYALVRSQGKEIQVANDFYSQLDLYYIRYDWGLVVATDMDLLPHFTNDIEYDQSAIFHSIYIYGYRPPKKQTFYSNVHRLGVGQYIAHDGEKVAVVSQPVKLLSIKNYDNEKKFQYKDIFIDAIEKRASEQGNVVYLSSGWDSTSILAGLVHILGPQKVTCIIGRMNFSMEKGVCNPFEIERAQKVADYFGVKLEIVDFDYYRRGPELTEEFEDFFKTQMATSMSMYQWLDLGKYVAKHHKEKSVFCGEISDGAHNFGFAQMITDLSHPDHSYREYADKMAVYLVSPSFLKSVWDGSFLEDSVYNLIKNKSPGKYDLPASSQFEKTKQILASQFTRDVRTPFWSLENQRFINEEGLSLYRKEVEDHYLDEVASQVADDPSKIYSGLIYLYNSFHWNGGTVQTVQMTEDLFDISVNLPFRDTRLIEYLASMPESWGRGLELRPSKYPLKWMLEHCIDYPLHLQTGPHSYLYDTDPDFDHAAEWNYRSAFASQYREMMARRKYRQIMDPNIFNVSYFDKIVDNYLDGKEVLKERSDLEKLIYLSVCDFY